MEDVIQVLKINEALKELPQAKRLIIRDIIDFKLSSDKTAEDGWISIKQKDLSDFLIHVSRHILMEEFE